MPTHQITPGSPIYLLLMLGGVIAGAIWWSRKFRSDNRLIQIYAGGIVGAFAGAKIAYLLAEGWIYHDSEHFWLQLASGKTILGALLGGYLTVEATKKLTGYTKPTGDAFAAAVPLGIAAGRIGCLAHGCCLGVTCNPAWYTIQDKAGIDRWPAPVAELLFNLAIVAILFPMRRHHVLPNQHFHLYLIAYGIFRFTHEFARNTPDVLGPLTGYQFLALLVTALGTWGFWKRQRQMAATTSRANRSP